MLTTSHTLLERLRDRQDQQAWRLFVQMYTPLLRTYAIYCGLQSSDVSDLVQEVLLIALKELPQFEYDPRRSFRGWLRRICENKAREFRRRRRVAGRQTGDFGLGDVRDAESMNAFWEHEYAVKIAQRALQLMRSEFEDTTWRACWEMTFHARPAAEVAAELGISPNACFIAKSRVLRRIRQLLADMM